MTASTAIPNDKDEFIPETRGAVLFPGAKRPKVLLLDAHTNRLFLEVINAADDLREAANPSMLLQERAYFAGLLGFHVCGRLTVMSTVVPGGRGRRLLHAHSVLLDTIREIRGRLNDLNFLDTFNPDDHPKTVHALSATLMKHFDFAADDAEVIASFILAERRESAGRHRHRHEG